MEYIYNKNIKKWINLETYDFVPNFDSKNNKKRIKLINRHSGINNGKGYSYIDPEDILFIWPDGTLYGECHLPGTDSAFNIAPMWVKDKKKVTKVVCNSPQNVINYVLVWADIIIRDPRNYGKVKNGEMTTEELFKQIEEVILPKFSEEQKLAYELQKERIPELLEEVRNQYNS